MSLQTIIQEFPEAPAAGDRVRHPFVQKDEIIRLKLGNPELLKGACYNLCIIFAELRLLEAPPADFARFTSDQFVQIAVRNQAHDNFDVRAENPNIRLGPYVPTITEREFGKKYCLFKVNTTLRNNLEIIDAIIAARAVSMLILRRGVGQRGAHAIAFDTRTNLTFFDPNYGWFIDSSAPVGAAYFRDWYHRFYHATPYNRYFANGRRQLVTWRAAAA